jgi:hypothetical protein
MQNPNFVYAVTNQNVGYVIYTSHRQAELRNRMVLLLCIMKSRVYICTRIAKTSFHFLKIAIALIFTNRSHHSRSHMPPICHMQLQTKHASLPFYPEFFFSGTEAATLRNRERNACMDSTFNFLNKKKHFKLMKVWNSVLSPKYQKL